MATREVFVDTSALYAFVDKRDAHHAEASRIVGDLARGGRFLVLSDYVVAEAINLAKVRGGMMVALRILDLLEQTGGIRVEWIGQARFAAAKAFFRKQADHGYSFTDCTSFVLMRELRLADVLTTDRHFFQAGFHSLLSPR